jgi:hypothetical protein
MLDDFLVKLRYRYFSERSEGMYFSHTWFCDSPSVGTEWDLWRIVDWCHDNWNSEPNFDHEWHYKLQGSVDFMYQKKGTGCTLVPFS